MHRLKPGVGTARGSMRKDSIIRRRPRRVERHSGTTATLGDDGLPGHNGHPAGCIPRADGREIHRSPPANRVCGRNRHPGGDCGFRAGRSHLAACQRPDVGCHDGGSTPRSAAVGRAQPGTLDAPSAQDFRAPNRRSRCSGPPPRIGEGLRQARSQPTSASTGLPLLRPQADCHVGAHDVGGYHANWLT